METKRIEIDGKDYLFICESWDTRSGFAHGCRMVDAENWETAAEAKRFYLNRTWECWRYQSVILDAIDKMKGYRAERIADKLRSANGWKNITKKRREALTNALAVDPEYITLGKLREEVGGYYPAWA